jgi:hypothetical protein
VREAAFALVSLASLAACHGAVGPCAGGGCPQLPGCEGTSAILCDPEHICVERVCEGVGWICGVDEAGNFSWARKSAPCSDGDPCTAQDVCVDNACRGKPLECKTPPPASCKDSQTLRAYDAAGFCDQGTCRYVAKELACPQGCEPTTGSCIGAPCVGVSCTSPPGPCFKNPGSCGPDGKCGYEPLAAGSPCVQSDPCVEGSTCDAYGACSGKPKDCARPHALEGSCVQGACQGYKCEAGWGDCNSRWDDGCETKLDGVDHCGKCGEKCLYGANSSTSCVGGKCVLSCKASFADCDKNPASGCEIPVGKPNVCNRAGLASFTGSTPPCGTAHCGTGSGSSVKSFGTWHCKFCSHSHKFSNGYSWCLGSDDGNFSPARCSDCSNDSQTDKTCN